MRWTAALALVLAGAGSARADDIDTGTLTLHGYIQADAVAYSQASAAEITPAGQPENETRFLIRRARLAARYTRDFGGLFLELDGNTTNGVQARLFDAEIFASWRGPGEVPPAAPPLVLGALGLMQIPFGREVRELDRERLFLERSSIASALFPGVHDLGVRVEGGWNELRYVFAVMNGEPVGERSFPGVDANPAKDALGRLGVALARGPFTLTAGVSGLVGSGLHPGTPASKDTLVWRDVNENGIVETTEIQVIAGSAATASQTYDRFAIGGDLLLTVTTELGATTLAGELMWAENLDRGVEPADPVSAGRDLRELGYYVMVMQELGRWAEVGVRYDDYKPDRDSSERIGADLVPRNDHYAQLAVVAAFRASTWLRLVAEYDHNWNSLGRALDGQPTTLGSDLLTFRGQVTY